jgi:hypothetical protein
MALSNFEFLYSQLSELQISINEIPLLVLINQVS